MDDAAAALDRLRTLCRTTLGPRGEEVLLFAPPDPPLITSDAHAVLRAWRHRDQAPGGHDAVSAYERVVLDAIEGLYREVGDGTASLLLLLHSVVRQASTLVGNGAGSEQTASRARLARAFATLRHQWDAGIMLASLDAFALREEFVVDQETARPMQRFVQRTEQVLTTALSGSVGDCAVQTLVRLVLQWLFVEPLPQHATLGDFYKRAQLFLKQAPTAVVHMHGAAFEASNVVPMDEFVLRKSLIPTQLTSMLAESVRTGLAFVCFTCALDLSGGSNRVVIETRGQDAALHAMDSAHSFVDRFLTNLRASYAIGLLISTEAIDPRAAETCLRLGVACVQYAEQDDVTALCRLAGIMALSSLFDRIEHEQHVGYCSGGASPLRLQQTSSLHLRGIVRRRDGTASHLHDQVVVPQLLLRAPTKGVYKQYYNALLKTLRVLRSWCQGPGSRGAAWLCRGAGSTELGIARQLRSRAAELHQIGEDCDTRMTGTAMCMVATALVELVAQLRGNMVHVCGEDIATEQDAELSSRRLLLAEMSHHDVLPAETDCKGFVLGMNHAVITKLGSIVIPELTFDDPIKFGVVHPWRRMDAILHMLHQTTEQLLRVDTVVFVRRDASRRDVGMHVHGNEDE